MKKLLFSITALTAACALQAAEVTSSALTFSTPGPDRYADGTTVLDGEIYALVWSQDGNFDGLTADGKVVDDNDKLVAALPLAKGGRCPEVVFNIADGFVSGGQFDILLLDTRKFADGAAKVAGVDASGKLTIVNAASKVEGAQIADKAPASADTSAAIAGDAAVATADPANAPQPVITGMKIIGDNVVLTVENTLGCLNYAVEGAETIGGASTVGEPKTGNDGTITLVYPKNGNAGFFKVIRK